MLETQDSLDFPHKIVWLYNPNCSQFPDPPAFTSQMLDLQACVTMPGSLHALSYRKA